MASNDSSNLKHGIITHTRRSQPHTVWWRGEVIKFCDTYQEAEQVFNAEEARQSRRGR